MSQHTSRPGPRTVHRPELPRGRAKLVALDVIRAADRLGGMIFGLLRTDAHQRG